MITVHKYKLAQEAKQTVCMPAGAVMLHVGTKHGEVYLWAKIDTNNPTGAYIIKIHGTGRPIALGDWGEYIGTVVLSHNGEVLHVCVQQ